LQGREQIKGFRPVFQKDGRFFPAAATEAEQLFGRFFASWNNCRNVIFSSWKMTAVRSGVKKARLASSWGSSRSTVHPSSDPSYPVLIFDLRKVSAEKTRRRGGTRRPAHPPAA